MPRAVLIRGEPGPAADELAAAFRHRVEPTCQIDLIAEDEPLLARIATDPLRQLVILDHSADAETPGHHLGLIGRIRDIENDVPIVVVTERGSVEIASAAVNAGATDMVVRGPDLERRIGTLLGKLRALFDMIDRNRALDQRNVALLEELRAKFKIVGESSSIKKMLRKIQRIAEIPRPVLIIGERGTGKELVARAIHHASFGEQKPIVVVNCAAFTDTLLESELFGHEKGAFTGADHTKPGRFEQANEGTLFLDEIGHMSLPFQQKILRVVEYGTFNRVGGTREIKVAVRTIAATNSDLKHAIREGTFLADLYDRLSFEVLDVPPLRERQGDIAVLAQHFLNQFAREIPAFHGKTLSQAAIDMLQGYSFPGNIRELKNIVERAAYRDVTNEITPEDIGMLASEEIASGVGTFKEKIDAFSKRLIIDALDRAEDNQAQAARLLGLSYHQFRYYHRKFVLQEGED